MHTQPSGIDTCTASWSLHLDAFVLLFVSLFLITLAFQSALFCLRLALFSGWLDLRSRSLWRTGVYIADSNQSSCIKASFPTADCLFGLMSRCVEGCSDVSVESRDKRWDVAALGFDLYLQLDWCLESKTSVALWICPWVEVSIICSCGRSENLACDDIVTSVK